MEPNQGHKNMPTTPLSASNPSTTQLYAPFRSSLPCHTPFFSWLATQSCSGLAEAQQHPISASLAKSKANFVFPETWPLIEASVEGTCPEEHLTFLAEVLMMLQCPGLRNTNTAIKQEDYERFTWSWNTFCLCMTDPHIWDLQGTTAKSFLLHWNTT